MYQRPIMGKEKVFITTIIYLGYLNSFFFFENHERNHPPPPPSIGRELETQLV